MECYCFVRSKPIRQEITKPQTATVISCGFEVCLHILNVILIGQYTINIPEKFQVFTVSEFFSKSTCNNVLSIPYINQSVNQSINQSIKQASKQPTEHASTCKIHFNYAVLNHKSGFHLN